MFVNTAERKPQVKWVQESCLFACFLSESWVEGGFCPRVVHCSLGPMASELTFEHRKQRQGRNCYKTAFKSLFLQGKTRQEINCTEVTQKESSTTSI